jgi:superfamily II DNA/RNA helicase
MVIQFDCASTVEEYMHQVGRCAMLINSTMSSSSSTKSSSSSSFQMTRKVASLYFPKGNKHFRTGHPWLGGTGGWAITFINKSNQPVFQKLYHQYLKNLSSSELTPLPQQLLNQVKKL